MIQGADRDDQPDSSATVMNRAGGTSPEARDAAHERFGAEQAVAAAGDARLVKRRNSPRSTA